jgi:hypothetical protein
MIQTIQPFFYEDRGDKIAKIKIEIESFATTKTGVVYKVNDWAVEEDGTRTLYKTKDVPYSNETINGLDAYISANNDFTGMTKTEREWAKMKVALMLDTQTNLLGSGTTIYRLNPSDWEFTPEQ